MKLMLVVDWKRTTLQKIGTKFASGEHSVPATSGRRPRAAFWTPLQSGVNRCLCCRLLPHRLQS
jgi:hypothetical protein